MPEKNDYPNEISLSLEHFSNIFIMIVIIKCIQ